MDQQIKLFRVFIATPNDLGDERRALRDVVERLNAICSKETDWRIELLGWEDTLPGTGRPQELINADVDKADLFVGCLWQKLGSPAGSGNRTGFEEEFHRSLERHKATGSPEMWLFFREVDPVRRSDPGEQLRKVLAFREQQIEGKQLLFKEFKGTADWRELIHDLLLRRIFQLVATKGQRTEGAQGTGSAQSQAKAGELAPESSKAQPKTDVGFTSLTELLGDAKEKVSSGKLAAFGRTEPLNPPACARLLVFAAANYDWNAQHIEFGTHEINSVYLHRSALSLTGQERLFILRTVLLDHSLTKPGWFWSHEWKLSPDVWLPYFATEDSDNSMREAAIALATCVGFPLWKRSKKSGKAIFRILQDPNEAVRIAGLRYLAAHGRAADLHEVEGLLTDNAKDVRAESGRTVRLIRLKTNTDAELRKSIQQADSFDDEEMVRVLAAEPGKITSETLEDALAHPSGALRAFAAKELLNRGSISKELRQRMCADEAKAVKECGYLTLVRFGTPNVDFSATKNSPLIGAMMQLQRTSSPIDLADVHAAFDDATLFPYPPKPSWNKANAETVISALLERVSPDVLWQCLDAFDADSHLALRALAGRYFNASAEAIRSALKDDFNQKAAAAKNAKPTLPLLSQPVFPASSLLSDLIRYDPIENVREELRVAALEILAEKPSSHDRELFLQFISNESSNANQTVACLRGLASVGLRDDREKIQSLLSSSVNFVQAASTRAYLALSPSSNVAAKELLSEPSEQKVWTVIAVALSGNAAAVWPALEPLLAHENDDIRRMVSYYAVRVLPKKRLRKLLDNYLARGRYFYNVVVLLDRDLHAPATFQTQFLKEERAYLDKWHSAATLNWPGIEIV